MRGSGGRPFVLWGWYIYVRCCTVYRDSKSTWRTKNVDIFDSFFFFFFIFWNCCRGRRYSKTRSISFTLNLSTVCTTATDDRWAIHASVERWPSATNIHKNPNVFPWKQTKKLELLKPSVSWFIVQYCTQRTARESHSQRPKQIFLGRLSATSMEAEMYVKIWVNVRRQRHEGKFIRDVLHSIKAENPERRRPPNWSWEELTG